MSDTLRVHATTVAIGGRAILLRGPSGSGKSDLALRLIDAGARLVADDQSVLRRDAAAVLVSAPPSIAGLIEVRGVGILRLDAVPTARLCLIADLVAAERVERLPDPSCEPVLGVPIPRIAVAPFEASASAKLRLALAALSGDGMVEDAHR